MEPCVHCGLPCDLEQTTYTWDSLCSNCGNLTWIKPGEVRLVRIVELSQFGARVDVGDGIIGLIHRTELDEPRIQHPAEVVEVGELVEAVVLHIELDSRHIGLSTRRVTWPAGH